MKIRKTLVIEIDPSINEHLEALKELQELEQQLDGAGVVVSSTFNGEEVKEAPKAERKPTAAVKSKTETVEPQQVEPEVEDPQQAEEPQRVEEPQQVEEDAPMHIQDRTTNEIKEVKKSDVTLEQIRTVISELNDAQRVLAKKALNQRVDANGNPCKNATVLQEKDYEGIFADLNKIKNGTYEG